MAAIRLVTSLERKTQGYQEPSHIRIEILKDWCNILTKILPHSPGQIYMQLIGL